MWLLLLACADDPVKCGEGTHLEDGECVADPTIDTGDAPIDSPPDSDPPDDSEPVIIDEDGDGWSNADDCKPDDPLINPGATESCDGEDNDCDGYADEGAGEEIIGSTQWFQDADHDGYGNEGVYLYTCNQPPGYVDGSRSFDCNDADDGVSPGAAESCDPSESEEDEDCDGVLDEDDAIDAITWYADADGDGYGDPSVVAVSCDAPAGYVEAPSDCTYCTDCDDSNAAVHPDLAEVCGNGQDDNCDDSPNTCGIDGEASLTDADVIWTGDDAGDYTGIALGVGDLSGDGRRDLVISAPFHDGGGAEAGTVWVLTPADAIADTNGDGVADPVTARVGDGIAAIYGEEPAAYLGLGLLVVDANADGIDDVAVGLPGDDTASTDAGAIWLLHGPLAATSGSSAAALLLYGEDAADGVGRALAAGDIDADGTMDLLIGVAAQASAGVDAGAVYRLSADTTGAVSLAEASRLVGAGAGDEAGSALVTLDIDGDGQPDTAVGAPGERTGGDDAGAVFLINAWDGTDLTSAAHTLYGPTAGGRAGTALLAADLNGDGAEDLVVGAPDDSSGAYEGGAVYVVTDLGGTLAGAAAIFYASDGTTHAGQSLAAVGDINQDGQADLLIGAPGDDTSGTDAGGAFLVHGPFTGTADLAAAAAHLTGAAAGDYAGFSVAAPGDISGDGAADISLGAYGTYSGGSAAGAVYLFLGDSW